MSGNYSEEFPLLKKLLKTSAFRFVIIRYNHYSIVEKVKEDIKILFPNRPFENIDGETTNFKTLFESYQNLKSGFLFFDNFESLLKDQTRSTGEQSESMKVENARRHAITSGLNLRRDKLAKIPNALIVFVASSSEEKFMRTMMEKMPDLWSFRSLFLDIEEKIKAPGIGRQPSIETTRGIDPNIQSNKNAAEIRRLEKSLKEAKEDEFSLKLSIYPQLTDLLVKDGIYDKAIIYFDEWLEFMPEEESIEILVNKGIAQISKGGLVGGKETLSRCLNLSIKYKNKIWEGFCYELLGDILQGLGDLEGAIEKFEAYKRIFSKIAEQFPNTPSYKSNLANSYNKLGKIHYEKGNIEKALKFFIEQNILFIKLNETYPNNVSFKNGLANSYGQLGVAYYSLIEPDKSLRLFNMARKLFEELYKYNPNNVSYKSDLATSYEKLGMIHSEIGNIEKALKFFEDEIVLFKELYESYPNNVYVKNSLAISYANFGIFYTQKKLDKIKAKNYFSMADNLWDELKKDSPQFARFQINSEKMRNNLKRM